MKTRMICALLILALLPSFGLVTPVAAADFSVCADGCDYTTIQAAVDAAADGDEINVDSGYYTENVLVNKAVSIIGNEQAYLGYGGTPTVDANSTGDGFHITVDGVAIYGFDITNAKGAGRSGVLIEANNATIEWLTIHDSDNGIRNEGTGNHIYSNGIYDLADATYGVGIWLGRTSDASGASLMGNEVSGNRIGIQVGYNGSFGSTNAAISSNRIYSNTTSGLVNAGATGMVNAERNWWGSPSPDFSAIISGTVDHDPWYVDYEKAILSGDVDMIFDGISSILALQGIFSNIGDVTASTFTSFSGLYFEKRTNVADPATAIGRITFNSALDLSDSQTQTFLQALGANLQQSTGRIVFDARASATFAATGATLVMYNLPLGITIEQLIVRNDLGTVLDASTVVSATSFSQDPVTGDVTFTAAHFTQFDIAPIVTSITRVNPSPTSALSADFTVSLSEFVTGVDADDFSLTASGISGASVTDVSGSGTVYTVKVNTGFGSGTLRLDMTDNDTILDAAGNPLGGTGLGDGDYLSGQTYTVTRMYVFLPLVLR